MTGTPSSAPECLQGLPPVFRPTARVLVLGSMPGVRSLTEAQYYAHPRNAFWAFVGELIGVAADAPYAERLEAARVHGLALWDVIGRCRRPGSLDSRIDPASIEVNDLGGLIARCTQLQRIVFNGTKAAQEFERRVAPGLDARAAGLERIRLPSTSPANASIPREVRRAAWHEALRPVLGPT